MSKIAKQKALEAYPQKYDNLLDANVDRRIGYRQGYDKSMQDFLEKACEWLKSYRQETSDKTGYIAGVVNGETIEQFKNYMSKNYMQAR